MGKKEKKQSIKIKKMKLRHHGPIKELMTSLGDWFDEKALSSILIDLQYQKGYVAVLNHNLVGFLSFFVYEAVGIISWIGVDKSLHGKSIGKHLLERMENELRVMGVKTLQVYTLSDSVDYEPYENTRLFYYRMGFKEHMRVKTGNPNCPEELYLRKDISGDGVSL